MSAIRTLGLSCFSAAVALVLGASGSVAGTEPSVITLTQTTCQFVEPENGVDHGFESLKKADCEAINLETGADRLAKAKVIELKPGRYIFRVTNENVPYDLGFWLRDHDYDWKNPLHKVTKTSVSGGGLSQGVTKD